MILRLSVTTAWFCHVFLFWILCVLFDYVMSCAYVLVLISSPSRVLVSGLFFCSVLDLD